MPTAPFASVRESRLDLPAVPVGPLCSVPDTGWSGRTETALDITALGADTIDTSGAAANLFPYQPQSHYSRDVQQRSFRTVVLENDVLRAEFLPELGGRLWRLTDKVADRELLCSPDRVQLGNLALRNAWFCGGMEFNIGSRGHVAHTCDPIGAGLVETDLGQSLRLWEFDRLREVVIQIDVWLPAESPALYAGVRIINPNPDSTPMYWWTNAAIAQTEDLQILAPGSTGIVTDYGGRLHRIELNGPDGVERTRPAAARDAFDLFFEMPAAPRHWIGTTDSDGLGVAIVSTGRLLGRKLFGWGTNAGGETWQRWLSPGGGQYCEIQAGLATTQYQHPRMPGHTTWDWVESYGPLSLGRPVADGHDSAVERATVAIDATWSADALAKASGIHGAVADQPVSEVWHAASDWGAVEQIRRVRSGSAWVDVSRTPFPAEPGSAAGYWVGVLSGRPRPAPDPAVAPSSYVRGADWETALAAAPADWWTEYHLGVMAMARGGERGAEEAATHFHRSLSHCRNAWSLLHLGLITLDRGGVDEAAAQLIAAAELLPDLDVIVVAATALLSAGAPRPARELLDLLPVDSRTPRTDLLELRCLAMVGDLGELRDRLRQPLVVPDIREGETALADLWQLAFPGTPVPAELDFRMHTPVGQEA